MANQGADSLLRTAIDLHREGKPKEAERLFRAVLQALGEETNALSYLALIEIERQAFDEALDLAIRATKADGSNPAAFHHLGMAYHGLNDFVNAANAYGKAVELAPGHLGALAMYARCLNRAGAHGIAAQAFRKLVSLAPRDPAVAFEAAVALQEAGAMGEAGFLYCRCLTWAPDMIEAWSNIALCNISAEATLKFHGRAYAMAPGNLMVLSNYGNALNYEGYREPAIQLLTQVLEEAPMDPRAHFNLGAAYGAADPGHAMVFYAMSVVLAPHFSNPWINIGGQLVRDRAFYAAARAYLRGMWTDFFNDRGRSNAALALMYAGEIYGPAQLFADSLSLRRGSAFWPEQADRVPPVPDDVSFHVANALKLRHDAEQLRYLVSKGLISDELASVADIYDEIRGEIETAQGAATVVLPPAVIERIGGVYNRVTYHRHTRVIEDGAISKKFDRAEVTRQYAEPPGIVVVDHLLSEQALAELRAFCLESTMWFDISHNFTDAGRGYLGANVMDGFSCPLLFQIAEEMRQALPDIFRDYPLMQMWSYKGDQQLQALDAHADAAAVNVNFWITPDEANLDPETGGLTVWTAEAPADWEFNKFNSDAAALKSLIDAPGVRRIEVPHAQNRALIFNSDLIHGSQPVNFAPGYENRRINVTMLYGTRDRDWQRLKPAIAS